MSDNNQPSDAAPPAGTLQECSDELMARVLGRDLQSATLLGALYLGVAGAILATIAMLAG